MVLGEAFFKGDPPAPTSLVSKGWFGRSRSLSPSICNKKYSETQVGKNSRGSHLADIGPRSPSGDSGVVFGLSATGVAESQTATSALGRVIWGHTGSPGYPIPCQKTAGQRSYGGYPGGYYGGYASNGVYANRSYVTGRPTLIPRRYGW